MPDGPSVTLIRPGLELAWWVAKLGSQARPAIEPPGRMRPFMKAAKLPGRYLESIREAVDDDGDFRSRVAAAADEEVLGRPSWLWLLRPEGWEAELATLGAAGSDIDSEKGEGAARRQLERVQADLVRVRAEVVVLQRANEALSAASKQDAQARRRAETARDRLQTDLQLARAETAKLAADAGERQSQLVAAGAEAEARNAQLEVDRAAAASAWQRAAAAASELMVALGELGRAAGVVGSAPDPAPSPTPAEPPRNIELDSSRSVSRPAERIGFDITGRPAPTPDPRRRRGGRRTPIPLPPAIFDDSMEAAAYLVRHTGILLVVDGYNVTLSSWAKLDLAEQRQRLIDALAELTARAGTTVHVVFDGVDGGGRMAPPPMARRRLRVEFSPSEIEADALIIDLVERLEPDRGAVVATNDRQVREEVTRRGANVISVAQLLAVLGRGAAAT